MGQGNAAYLTGHSDLWTPAPFLTFTLLLAGRPTRAFQKCVKMKPGTVVTSPLSGTVDCAHKSTAQDLRCIRSSGTDALTQLILMIKRHVGFSLIFILPKAGTL